MAAINLHDLTPFTRQYVMVPGDAWIFRMKFWQNFSGQRVPLDVQSMQISAKLYQLIDGNYKHFLTINETNAPLNSGSVGNYLYFEEADTNNNGIVFAADWLNEGNTMLSEGKYKLVFSYNGDLSFPKSFATYLVELTNRPREDAPAPIMGIDFFLILKPEILEVTIQNTIINNKMYP